MDTIRISYEDIAGEDKPRKALTVGAGLPEGLKETKPEYTTLLNALGAYIKKVNKLQYREVVSGELELKIQ